MDFFVNDDIDLNKITCHSGGAIGSDTYFETIGSKYGIKTKAYSYKTPKHTSVNKIEISEEDYLEGIKMIRIANKKLNRNGIDKYMNLLARNWVQVKYSKQTFAIGSIIKNGDKCSKGYLNKSGFDLVEGGTGYATTMSIDNNHDLFVFDQKLLKWFTWSYLSSKFIECELPKITEQDFAGIGTRNITEDGINAIKDLYDNTFN